MKSNFLTDSSSFSHPDQKTADVVSRLASLLKTQAQVNESCDRAANNLQSWRRTTNLVLGITAMAVPVLAVLATFASVAMAAAMIGLSVFSVIARRRVQFVHTNLAAWSKELQQQISYSKFDTKGNLASHVSDSASRGGKMCQDDGRPWRDDKGRGESGSGGVPVINPKSPNGPPPLAAAATATVPQGRAARG
jgi:hypothetical protein